MHSSGQLEMNFFQTLYSYQELSIFWQVLSEGQPHSMRADKPSDPKQLPYLDVCNPYLRQVSRPDSSK